MYIARGKCKQYYKRKPYKPNIVRFHQPIVIPNSGRKTEIKCRETLSPSFTFDKKETIEEKLSIGLNSLINQKQAQLILLGKESPNSKKQMRTPARISLDLLEAYKKAYVKVRSSTPFMKFLSSSIIHDEDEYFPTKYKIIAKTNAKFKSIRNKYQKSLQR